ncbi:DUF1353 domain-containing protein [Marinobacter sp. NFXS9]
MKSVRVEIQIPTAWRKRARYVLQEEVTISGVSVPMGFATDGATVPRIFWPVFPPVGEYFLAAAVHDYALIEGRGWSAANALFDSSLRELSVPSWRRRIMVLSVRLYGWYQCNIVH